MMTRFAVLCTRRNGQEWARWAESLSEKKAFRERREVRLISAQWGHFISVNAVSVWAAPNKATGDRKTTAAAGT